MSLNGKAPADVIELRTHKRRSAVADKPLSVADVMTKRPIMLASSASVIDAIRHLARHQSRHLIVADDGYLVGVVTDRDVMRSLASDSAAQERPITTCMTKAPVAIRPDTPISDAIRLLTKNRADCLPVVTRDGLVQGMLDSTDFLRVLHATRLTK